MVVVIVGRREWLRVRASVGGVAADSTANHQRDFNFERDLFQSGALKRGVGLGRTTREKANHSFKSTIARRICFSTECDVVPIGH